MPGDFASLWVVIGGRASRRWLARLSLFTIPDEIERDIDNHVFLTAYHSATPEFHQDFARIDAVVRTGLFGVAQE